MRRPSLDTSLCKQPLLRHQAVPDGHLNVELAVTFSCATHSQNISFFGPSSVFSFTLSLMKWSIPTRVLCPNKSSRSCVQYGKPGHADIETAHRDKLTFGTQQRVKQTFFPSVYCYPRLIVNMQPKMICMTCYTLYKYLLESCSRQTTSVEAVSRSFSQPIQ